VHCMSVGKVENAIICDPQNLILDGQFPYSSEVFHLDRRLVCSSDTSNTVKSTCLECELLVGLLSDDIVPPHQIDT
jgi:hypothetical protein